MLLDRQRLQADKASVLEGAIKQLKQLEEQVKTLEQHTKNKKTTGESVVFVKKDNYPMTSSMDTTSFDKSRWNRTVAKADVEARVSDKKVLIRVQCEKQEGIMVKTIKEIENLHLSVINSIVMPFGRSILDITIIAEVHLSSMHNLIINQIQNRNHTSLVALVYTPSGP